MNNTSTANPNTDNNTVNTDCDNFKVYTDSPLEELFKRDFDDNEDWRPDDPALQHIFDLGEYLNEFQHMLPIEELTANIKKDFLGYICVGLQIDIIIKKKLYKDTHSSFAQYCLDVLHMKSWNVYDYRRAARVFMTLMRGGFSYKELPKNISQCLTVDRYHDFELIKKWRLIVNRFKPHEYNAEKIDDYLHPKPIVDTYNTTLDVQSIEVHKKIEWYAAQRGMSISQLMLEMVEVYEAYYKVLEIPRIDPSNKRGIRALKKRNLEIWQQKLENFEIQIQELDLNYY